MQEWTLILKGLVLLCIGIHNGSGGDGMSVGTPANLWNIWADICIEYRLQFER